jgi:hypothetical protein
LGWGRALGFAVAMGVGEAEAAVAPAGFVEVLAVGPMFAAFAALAVAEGEVEVGLVVCADAGFASPVNPSTETNAQPDMNVRVFEVSKTIDK